MRLSKGHDNTLRKSRFWWYLTDRLSINLEYVLWMHFFGAEITFFDGDGDTDLQFHFSCGLFAVWLTFENFLPRKWQPKYDWNRRFSPTRQIGFSIHDQCIWMNLWNDPMGWSKDNPWWWSFTLHPVDWLFGKTQYSNRDIKTYPNIPLKICEHEVYPAKVQLFESTWKRPRWRANKLLRATVEVEGGVPHPGKGTMSYNCGDDATFSLTCPAKSAKEALKKFRDNILDMRERYPL